MVNQRRSATCSGHVSAVALVWSWSHLTSFIALWLLAAVGLLGSIRAVVASGLKYGLPRSAEYDDGELTDRLCVLRS